MAHTYSRAGTRTSSTGNPITVGSTAINAGETVFVVMLHVVGATNRAGGSLTLGPYTLTQANSTQKAVTSPEGSTELWYLLNALPGSYTLTIPNTGALTIRYQTAWGKAKGGGTSFVRGSNGGNGTSTNPTPGAISCISGDICFSTVFSGATTWAPSARQGTQIQDTDDGAFGGGTQYYLVPSDASVTMNWTFGTSDDWGSVSAAFGEIEPINVNNLMGFDAGDGISVTEKFR